MSKLKINHVMSNKINSGIYESLVSYFKRYANDCEIVVSEKPLDDMDVYHYYRPHLENKLKPNSVVTVHHDLNDTDSWLSFDKFINRYKEAEKIICLNSNQKEFLKKHGILNTTVIPHGYNSDIFDIGYIRKPIKSEKLNIGIVSKRYGRKVKGEAYLYELIKYLDNTKFKFTLIGDGRLDDAIKLMQWGFEVEVYEYLPYKCFANLYKEMDLLLMMSSFEGGPANIPEAVVCKVPIIAFDIGMVSDFVVNNETGLLLTGDVIKDSSSINLLANNRSLYNQLVKSCNKIPVNLYSWKEVVVENSKIYMQLAENKAIDLNE